MSDSAQERTQEPTPRRRQMARQQGHVARSHDLVAAFVCLAAIGMLLLAGPLLWRGAGQMLREQLSQVSVAADDVDYHVQTWRRLGLNVAACLGPWLLGVCAAAYAIQAVQIGWLWLPQKVVPDLQRVAPARGLQRLLDPDQAVRAVLLLLKLASVLGLAAWLFWQQLPTVQSLGGLMPADLVVVGGSPGGQDRLVDQLGTAAAGSDRLWLAARQV